MPIHLSFHLSIHLSNYLSVHLCVLKLVTGLDEPEVKGQCPPMTDSTLHCATSPAESGRRTERGQEASRREMSRSQSLDRCLLCRRLGRVLSSFDWAPSVKGSCVLKSVIDRVAAN